VSALSVLFRVPSQDPQVKVLLLNSEQVRQPTAYPEHREQVVFS
jgi:hypothetical protein